MSGLVFRVSCFLFLAILLPVFFSCGNSEGDKQQTSSADSIPSDILALNEKIEKDRNNPELYFNRAKIYFSHKDFENAINDMKIVLKIDSTRPDYYIFISDLYFTQNKTRDTRDALRKAIALDSSNAPALMKYSQLFYLLEKYDTAVYYVNRSLNYDNSSPVAHFQKGMILKEWGDTAKAISSFQSAVERDQKYYDAYMQLGILLSVKKNPLALDYLNNALTIDPKSIEALYAKGMFYQNVSDDENALKIYNSILESDAEHPDANYNIGAIWFNQKKYNDALQKFNDLINRDENFYRAYYGRGRCYEAMGDKIKAAQEYRKCLALKPDYELAAFQLGHMDSKRKKL